MRVPGKAPRYFCEHCGLEVKRDAHVCPGCGRFFSSVKCPKCGYSGNAGKFRSGCPVCGYSGAVVDSYRPVSGGKRRETIPLSTWLYLLAFALLLVSIFALWTALR